MSRLTDLIEKAKAEDPQLGADLEREFRALSSRLPFGLNFERHQPEAVELPRRPVRRGDKVRVLPPRGETKKGDQRLWEVKRLISKTSPRLAELESIEEEPEHARYSVEDLVVVAAFGDTIFPGLVSTGRVDRGGDRPYHTVINAENYHALKTLTWTHRGKVDAIYIDPPYNTGAKDWKYNNDYVESEDAYRHSKWLAMMERRLLLAKELLNPTESVLIVTIDEKEYLRLGLLLEQIFTEGRIQMVTTVINPTGVSRPREFARAEEYVFFVFFGNASICPWDRNMLEYREDTERTQTIWNSVLRRGSNARRQDRSKMFYPVWVDPENEIIAHIGNSIPLAENRESVKSPRPGLVACWPLRSDGSEGNWQLQPETMRKGLADGTVKLGSYKPKAGQWAINYLRKAEKERIKRGEIKITGRGPNGELELEWSGMSRATAPVTVWNMVSHNASSGGSNLLRSLIPGQKFPFPKSLFAVEDCLRFIVANNPNAIVLDFFAGSGTTAHAVMRLNKQDGGRRQCISVTNNEVAAEEQKALRDGGLRPGDQDWDKFGICEYITKPRVKAAITGKTPDGAPIRGSYKFTDEFPIADGFEANAEFFTLTYETPTSVKYQTAFARVAPLLWMRAGCEGNRIDRLPKDGWDVVDRYGLLSETDAATEFLKAVRKAEGLRIAFIVTDDERRFQAIARKLPDHIEAIRLYESYLTNFAFANGESE